MNLIDKVNNYFNNYAFNDEANIETSNKMLESIEKELIFKNEKEHQKWLDVVACGTGEEIEQLTKKIAIRGIKKC